MQFRLPIRPYLILARYRRALTLGVRAVILEQEAGLVFLVRHSYVAGWHFPGGAVEPRETVMEAVRREANEEAGIALDGSPELFGLYLNRRYSQRDHVAVFVCREWHRDHEPRVPNLEISEVGFFPVDALPAGTTGPTERRLAEILRGEPRRPDW